MMVEHQGKVVTLGHIRGILIFLSLILAAVFSAGVFLFYLYHASARRAVDLENALIASEQRIAPLRNEKDILMARLVVAEEKIEMLQSNPRSMPVEEQAKAPEKSSDATPAATLEPSLQQNSRPRVDVEEFEIQHFPEKAAIEVKFRLVNENKKAGPVSGYIFVLIRKSQEDDQDSIVLPKTRFDSGKPQVLNAGRYFMISRFTLIRLKTAFHGDAEQYNYVTVLIFSQTGDLLLEKNFPFPKDGRSKLPPE